MFGCLQAEGPSVDVHINVSHGPQMQSESQLRINQAMHMLSLASTTLDRLEVFCLMSALLDICLMTV